MVEYQTDMSLVDQSISQNEADEPHLSDPDQMQHINSNGHHVNGNHLIDTNNQNDVITLEEEVVYGHPQGSRMGRLYKKSNWAVEEMLVLQAAKREDRDRHERGSKSSQNPAQDRWNWIEDYCWTLGVQRSAQQCHDKWEVISTAYKKVYNIEKYVCSGQKSYWNMLPEERKKNKLPPNFQREIFNALLEWCNTKIRNADSGELVVDTSGPLLPSGDAIFPIHLYM